MEKEIADIFKVLGNADRLRILSKIMNKEFCVGQIEEDLDLKQSTVSQHLSVLRKMGIVKSRRDQNKVCYEIENKLVKELLTICCKNKKMKGEKNG